MKYFFFVLNGFVNFSQSISFSEFSYIFESIIFEKKTSKICKVSFVKNWQES